MKSFYAFLTENKENLPESPTLYSMFIIKQAVKDAIHKIEKWFPIAQKQDYKAASKEERIKMLNIYVDGYHALLKDEKVLRILSSYKSQFIEMLERKLL